MFCWYKLFRGFVFSSFCCWKSCWISLRHTTGLLHYHGDVNSKLDFPNLNTYGLIKMPNQISTCSKAKKWPQQTPTFIFIKKLQHPFSLIQHVQKWFSFNILQIPFLSLCHQFLFIFLILFNVSHAVILCLLSPMYFSSSFTSLT